jgi:hypothetical protein
MLQTYPGNTKPGALRSASQPNLSERPDQRPRQIRETSLGLLAPVHDDGAAGPDWMMRPDDADGPDENEPARCPKL